MTMINIMVTRVCRAMNLDPGNGEHRQMSRAAIKAMRDPTPRMVEANSDAGGPDDAQTIKDWQAMIDAALDD